MGKVTRSSCKSTVARTRSKDVKANATKKTTPVKKQVSVNKTSAARKRKRNAVNYAEVSLRKSSQEKVKSLPIYKQAVKYVRENKVNDVYEFDLREVVRAEKCNASHVSDSEFDKDIELEMITIKKLEKKKAFTKKKPKNIVKSPKKGIKPKETIRNIFNKKGYKQKNIDENPQLKPKIGNETMIKRKAVNKIASNNVSSSKKNKTVIGNLKHRSETIGSSKSPANSINKNVANKVLSEKENNKELSPRQINILNNIVIKPSQRVEEGCVTLANNSRNCDPNFSIPPYCSNSLNGGQHLWPSNSSNEVPAMDHSIHLPSNSLNQSIKKTVFNKSNDLYVNSPWRPNLILRNGPRFMTTKQTNLPIYDQDVIINSTIIENTFSKKGKNSKKLKQKSILDFVTGGAAKETSVLNCSLYDIDQLSPIKKVSQSPFSNKFVNSNKKVRKPLGSWNNQEGLISSQEEDAENSSLWFEFDKENKENVPAGKPTRFSGIEPKLKKNLFSKLIGIPEKEQNGFTDQTVDENCDGNVPIVGLFEDLETVTKAPPRASYGRKYPKRTRCLLVEEEDESEDEHERIKRRKKDQRTKAEELAAKNWEKEFNKMCTEVDKHELEIEVI